MTEAELRELAGVASSAEVRFCGETFAIREDGLAALIRFARASISEDPEQPVPLAAIYRLFEDCVIDFTGFGALALSERAGFIELTPVVHALTEFYCGRNHWPAMRLIGYVAASLEELDGLLIKAGGRGIAHLSAREACNVALAMCLDGRNDEDRQIFMDDLNYEGSPEAEALAQLRAMQRMQKQEVMDGGLDAGLE